MSDKMTPIPFSSLLNTLRSEYGASGTLFGVTPSWRGEPSKQLSLFGENLEVPLGPAAPHPAGPEHHRGLRGGRPVL